MAETIAVTPIKGNQILTQAAFARDGPELEKAQRKNHPRLALVSGLKK